jgi:hypothetical protein
MTTSELAARAREIAAKAPTSTATTGEAVRSVADLRAGELICEDRLEVITCTKRIVEVEAVGSKGIRRRITADGDGWRCTCPSWFHRFSCVHIDAAKKVVAAPGLRRLPPDEADQNATQQRLDGEASR